MIRFILTKIGLLVPTFLGVTLLAFLFIRLLPGDPIELMAGERGVDPQRHAQLMAQLGYDRPLWRQYVGYVGEVAQGDLGRSIVTKQPVLTEFLTLFPATIELSICAILVAVLIGRFSHAFLSPDTILLRSNGSRRPSFLTTAGMVSSTRS